jgi:flagellar basal-body rod protein FlgF
MSDGIYVALSGAVAQQEALDATATNLANAATAGYQRLRPVFNQSASAGSTNFASALSFALDSSAGALRTTGRPLDVAVPAGSYLAVQTPAGERYTRAGSISLAADGSLTAHGAPVLGEGGAPLKANAKGGEITITPGGEVRQAGSSIGRLRVVSFASAGALTPEGGALLAPTATAGTPTIAHGELQVGVLEESNVSVVGAMTELVTASRSFDAYQRAIDTFRDADRAVVSRVPNADG